jgi:hypothetical protein
MSFKKELKSLFHDAMQKYYGSNYVANFYFSTIDYICEHISYNELQDIFVSHEPYDLKDRLFNLLNKYPFGYNNIRGITCNVDYERLEELVNHVITTDKVYSSLNINQENGTVNGVDTKEVISIESELSNMLYTSLSIPKTLLSANVNNTINYIARNINLHKLREIVSNNYEHLNKYLVELATDAKYLNDDEIKKLIDIIIYNINFDTLLAFLNKHVNVVVESDVNDVNDLEEKRLEVISEITKIIDEYNNKRDKNRTELSKIIYGKLYSMKYMLLDDTINNINLKELEEYMYDLHPYFIKLDRNLNKNPEPILIEMLVSGIDNSVLEKYLRKSSNTHSIEGLEKTINDLIKLTDKLIIITAPRT